MKLFTKKVVTKLSKYEFGIRDPGSGINPFRIPDPGVKKAPDPGSATLLFKPEIKGKNSGSIVDMVP
jgi:hypothetical protein